MHICSHKLKEGLHLHCVREMIDSPFLCCMTQSLSQCKVYYAVFTADDMNYWSTIYHQTFTEYSQKYDSLPFITWIISEMDTFWTRTIVMHKLKTSKGMTHGLRITDSTLSK
jgi:hypothetical protein